MFNYRFLPLPLVLASVSACSGGTQPTSASTATSTDTAAQSQALAADGSAPRGERHHGPPDGGRPHRPPPPEAFTACEGKTADAACSVTVGDHTLEGTCRTPPPDSAETRLACAPAHGPGGRPPPPR